VLEAFVAQRLAQHEDRAAHDRPRAAGAGPPIRTVR